MRLTLLKLLIPVLMLGVIAIQVWRVRTLNQTPWKGGGFGMFSTNDHRPTRVATITATVEGRELLVDLSEARSYLKEKFLGAPNEESLAAFTSRLAELKWQLDPTGQLTDIKGTMSPGAIEVNPTELKISYFKINFFRSGVLKPELTLSKQVSL